MKKKKTLNVQPAYAEGFGVAGAHLSRRSESERGTFNIEWTPGRVKEEPDDYGASSLKDQTFNAQRSTLNVQPQTAAQFDLEERLLEFSARIIRLVDALPNRRSANHLAGQLLRCGTSPFGNHGEVQAAESRKDFIHKLRICLKELKETRRWLRLLQRAALLPAPKMAAILSETEELIKIFFTSIRTAEKKSK